jgi:hypothetical protein
MPIQKSCSVCGHKFWATDDAGGHPVRCDDCELLEKHGWAVKIVRGHFAEGLERICDRHFLDERYLEFLRKQDPVYTALLDGMKDEALAKTFVSYWTIGQTMATQSRFWLEDSIAEIIVHQAENLERPVREVYSQAMLGTSEYPKSMIPIAMFGEWKREHLSERSPWRPAIQEQALSEIDVLVGKQERQPPPTRELLKAWRLSREGSAEAVSRDRKELARVYSSLSGPPATETPVQCNLLVIEPDRLDREPHAWGIRFINPKTIAQHATRKQERVNLLRLYALLVQEKIMRDPRSIRVCVAELLPRMGGRDSPYPDYFSPATYWSSKQLWDDFIGVPFGVVSIAIREEAQAFRQRLKEGLQALLPHGEEVRRHVAAIQSALDAAHRAGDQQLVEALQVLLTLADEGERAMIDLAERTLEIERLSELLREARGKGTT